jgi:hypothetical protein
MGELLAGSSDRVVVWQFQAGKFARYTLGGS